MIWLFSPENMWKKEEEEENVVCMKNGVVVFKYFFAQGLIFEKSVRDATVFACRAITELLRAGHQNTVPVQT